MPDAFGNIDAEGQDEGTSNVTNFEVNPHGINYTMAAWLYTICKAWDLVPYARERYNEYSNNEKSWAKDVEAGAQATNLPGAACLQVCKRCWLTEPRFSCMQERHRRRSSKPGAGPPAAR